MTKLREEDLVCAEVLISRSGRSIRSTAQDLGVSESTLRYRLKRSGRGGGGRPYAAAGGLCEA